MHSSRTHTTRLLTDGGFHEGTPPFTEPPAPHFMEPPVRPFTAPPKDDPHKDDTPCYGHPAKDSTPYAWHLPAKDGTPC